MIVTKSHSKVLITLIATAAVFSFGVLMRPRIASIYHRVKNKIVRIAFGNADMQQCTVSDPLYPLMTSSQYSGISDAIRFTFVGDLILLRDAVEYGYQPTTNDYNYDDVFAYTLRYFHDSDFVIGVFEGPMAGDDARYTSSDFYDCNKIQLYLNFPDEFGAAVKHAGFDLVTLANNHLLDKGETGAKTTMRKLKGINLDFTCAYEDRE